MAASAPLVAVLAAGRGTRFGGGKLDAPCAGRPLGCWALAAVAAAGLAPGICITGPQPPQFLAGASGWTGVINPRPQEGLAGSLVAAVRAAQARGCAALLVVLGDMPLVTPALLAGLAAQAGPAATDHGGHPGVPALLPAALFSALTQARGDHGASRLLACLPGLTLVAPPPATLLDVDTPADLARAATYLAARAGS